MEDRIAKQRLNVILLIDCSTSMRGERIKQVNNALLDIKTHLIDMQKENSNVDFYMTVVPFSTDASFLNGERMKNVEEFDFTPLKAGGWSNLHLAYEKLDDILKKESKGGIMPDFGGIAPIVLLLTDGHPTGAAYKDVLAKLQTEPWFKVALRYGIAIELDDQRTMKVLQDFVGNNGDVISCFDANVLENIIKIIVLTASKVKSGSSRVTSQEVTAPTVNDNIKQEVAEALTEVDEWEW